jgi:hypothetical protein
MVKLNKPPVPLEKLVKDVAFGTDEERQRLRERIRELRNQLEALRRRWKKVKPL